ncbi:hypothetical protein BDF14DRAFT_1789383 [Spinellus fusiger]|nr:hypothetical protein BDF14DRAFT_1789383 [Spinellus fusiger]
MGKSMNSWHNASWLIFITISFMSCHLRMQRHSYQTHKGKTSPLPQVQSYEQSKTSFSFFLSFFLVWPITFWLFYAVNTRADGNSLYTYKQVSSAIAIVSEGRMRNAFLLLWL